MAGRKAEPSDMAPRRRPATTPEQRQNRLTAMAYDYAEAAMQNGTASSQIVTHFLKVGSIREQFELEKIRHENDLLDARVIGMATGKNIEELYGNAIEAMRSYRGEEDEEFDD